MSTAARVTAPSAATASTRPRRCGVAAAEAASGRHRGDRRLRGEFGLDQCGHAGREGDADVRFGKAEEAAVGAHHPKVVRQGQHCPGAEGVADHRGCGGDGQGEHPGQHALHAPDVPLRLVAVGRQPIQIQTIGVELAAARGDQTLRAGADDFIEAGVKLIEKAWRETVFVVAKVKDRRSCLRRSG